MYQQITLVGNLGNDPEMRYTPSGVPVASFRLAVNKSWTTQDGQRQDKTTWFRITTWRKTAEIVSQYLTKGRQVLVIGEVDEPRPYTDREGNLRASLEVTAQIVKFLGNRSDQPMSVNTPVAAAAVPTAGGKNNAVDEVLEEDIPF
ncbi:single-stranded DNA-binding protein [Chloroflexi bacterium TSY]|nr:single-stranded DNA-binding protein [Chloroflexi bacterium TSY]